MNIKEWLKERTFCYDEVDEILCVTFLLGKGKFSLCSDVREWIDYAPCDKCPFFESCPCCAINE